MPHYKSTYLLAIIYLSHAFILFLVLAFSIMQLSCLPHNSYMLPMAGTIRSTRPLAQPVYNFFVVNECVFTFSWASKQASQYVAQYTTYMNDDIIPCVVNEASWYNYIICIIWMNEWWVWLHSHHSMHTCHTFFISIVAFYRKKLHSSC